MATPSTSAETAGTRPLATQWVRLQQSVAAGQVIVFAGIMVIVRSQLIPPLAVAAVLFAAGALFSLRTPRAGAITVGALSAVWLLSNVAFGAQVVPDLLAIDVVEIFVPTFAMNVLAAAGTIGLVGAVMRAPGTVATRTAWVAGGLLALGIGASFLTLLA